MADTPSPDSDQKDADDLDDKSDVLATARERFKLAAEAENDIRREALDDLEFAAGNQWPQEIKNQRDTDARPCLVINRLPQFIRQITNDQRQNRPAIKVSPTDDKGTHETAEVFQGLIRHIEYSSSADIAYDTAFDSAVRAGRGFFRIVPDYLGNDTFDQELKIHRIRNPFMVYMDPAAKKQDGSDMEWCFIIEDLTHDEYEDQYGEIDAASLEEFQSIGDDAADWMTGDKIRVAEYFYKEFEEKTIHETSAGNVIGDDEKDHLPEGSTIKRSRVVQVPTIKWCKINAIKVLEESVWPGRWIPVIPVLGEEQDINGKLILSGIVRNAKDPQKMLNYWKSAETETIALAPRAPFVGAEGQFEGHELQWKAANVKNQAYLQYKPISVNGQPMPPPARQVYEPAVQAITNASMQAAQDIKDVTGIYDPSLGRQIADQSGIAIKRLNTQAQTTNFHFVDNLHRSLRHAGRILVDAIPYFYDTQRAVRIIGDDGETDIQVINAVFQKDGALAAHNMGAGKYDVAIDTGPSYSTKREEAVAAMLDMAKSLPQLGQAAPDLLVRAMDWPHAEAIADRLKLMLPPALQQDPKNQTPTPPQVQGQLTQQGNMIQQLTQQLHAALDQIDKKTLELESKERIAMAQMQTEVEIALAQLGSKNAQILLTQQVGAIQHRLDLLHSASSIDMEAQYDAQKQAQDQAHQQQMAQQASQQRQQVSNVQVPQGAQGQGNPTGGNPPGSPMGNP